MELFVPYYCRESCAWELHWRSRVSSETAMEKKESRKAGNCSDALCMGTTLEESSFIRNRDGEKRKPETAVTSGKQLGGPCAQILAFFRVSNACRINPLCPFCARQKIPQLPIAANGVCRLQFCGITRTHFAEEEEEEAFGSSTNPPVELKSVELLLSHDELQA